MSFMDDARDAGGLRGALMSMGPLGFIGGLLNQLLPGNEASTALQGIQDGWGGGQNNLRPDGTPMQITPPSATSRPTSLQNGLFGLLPGFGGVREMFQGRR